MSGRIRVIEIITGFGVESAGGGAGRFGLELGRNLDAGQFEASVCGLWDAGSAFERDRIEQLEAAGIQTFTAASWDEGRPYQSFLKAAQALQTAIPALQPHILHSHSEFGDMAALALKPSLKTSALVRTVHNGYRLEWRKRPLRRYLLSYFLYPLAYTKEVGVNQGIVDNLNRRWVARSLDKQAIRIPNAIDLKRFTALQPDQSRVKQDLGLPPDAFLVGSVGRMAEGKGYDNLLEAAALVLQRLPQTYFVLVGEGELAGQLKAMALRLGIASRVVFTGSRPDVEGLLAGLDLFVSASLWEGISTVILESMAGGTPVLATDIPGNREIIQDMESGWLVPTQDPAAMANGMINALLAPDQRHKIARQASESVKAFAIERVTAAYEELYRSCLRN